MNNNFCVVVIVELNIYLLLYKLQNCCTGQTVYCFDNDFGSGKLLLDMHNLYIFFTLQNKWVSFTERSEYVFIICHKSVIVILTKCVFVSVNLHLMYIGCTNKYLKHNHWKALVFLCFCICLLKGLNHEIFIFWVCTILKDISDTQFHLLKLLWKLFWILQKCLFEEDAVWSYVGVNIFSSLSRFRA